MMRYKDLEILRDKLRNCDIVNISQYQAFDEDGCLLGEGGGVEFKLSDGTCILFDSPEAPGELKWRYEAYQPEAAPFGGISIVKCDLTSRSPWKEILPNPMIIESELRDILDTPEDKLDILVGAVCSIAGERFVMAQPIDDVLIFHESESGFKRLIDNYATEKLE